MAQAPEQGLGTPLPVMPHPFLHPFPMHLCYILTPWSQLCQSPFPSLSAPSSVHVCAVAQAIPEDPSLLSGATQIPSPQ